ncbi:MAG: hypothetical protein QNK05_22720 [Myxococcota bacterium]|nr:hypothetical protein [Myxococcota bacterium]
MSTPLPAGSGGDGSRGDGCPPLAVGLLCVAFGLALFTALVPTGEHLGDDAWTAHQKFHAFREIFLASLFSVTGIVLCLGPLRRGEPHALSAVALLGVGVVAGFWLGLPITGIGKGGVEPFVNHGVQAVALVAGYGIARSRSGSRA